MKVYALWYGGNNYAAPMIPEDLEEFRSIESAKRVFDCRADSGYDPVSMKYTPCVDGDSMQLFFYDPREASDPYPDRIIERGPRGAVCVNRC